MFELQKHKTTCIHIQKQQQHKNREEEKKNKPIIYANNKFLKYE